MSDATDTRDKVIRLETEVAAMRRDMDDMSEKVSEMHELLLKAKGARWAFVVLWLALGAVVGKAADLLGLINWPPK